jgi:uncharacterized protein (DUF697 family)
LHLTLGRNFPGIRPDVLDYVIRNTACVNAEVAIVSGALFNIPSIGPIYPGVAFGDTVILTKNQVMMAFRLAGACGHAVDIVHRKTEVISIIGGGLGWRTLARAAAGAIPVLGIPLKGAFAFAGTFAVGKSLAHFLDTGRRLEPKTEQRIYADAVESGKVFASDTLRRLTRRQKAFRRRGRRT